VKRRIFFHVGRGGFFCEKCNAGVGALQISSEALIGLTALQSLPARKITQHKFSSPAMQEIEKFFQSYYRFHLEEIGRLQAIEFIGDLNDRRPINIV
jgi:hypothetical protein